MADYYLQEIELTKKLFNLDEMLAFQLEHDVQVIRGEDYVYHCWIDKKAYGTSLTPMLALVYGIKCFKENS